MKNTLVFAIAATLIGVIGGWGYTQASLLRTERHFGPFSTSNGRDAAAALEYLAEKQAVPQPEIEVVGGNLHDVGAIRRGGEGEHVFIVKNTGQANLELDY
ncbi:MAG: hypothetical protein AAFP69_18275, partial [Planctomycetota bacterium]